ncbi:MAG: HEAT repeat domain-containing protein [Fimbriiglobus sp.]
MKNLRRWVLLAAVVGFVGGEVSARPIDFGLGLLKRRQAKPDPVSRAKQLIETLKSDPDEAKRRAAALELRGMDPRNNADVIPALTLSLQKDPSPIVRIEAIDSLGKLKPVSQTAGLAMESALETEPDAKVRDSIKAALWQYHLNGYKTPSGSVPLAIQGGGDNTPGTTTSSKSTMPRPTDTAFQPIKNSVGKIMPAATSTEPALAPKKLPAPNNVPPKSIELPKPVPSTPPAPMPAKPPVPTVTIPTVTPPAASTPTPMPQTLPTTPTVTPPPSSIPLPTIPEAPVPGGSGKF